MSAATWNYAAASGGISDTNPVTMRAADKYNVSLDWLDIINTAAAVDTEVIVKAGSTVVFRTHLLRGGAGARHIELGCIKVPHSTAITVECGTTSSKTYVNAGGRRLMAKNSGE